MRQRIQDFNSQHGNQTRMALFQLAALGADYLLFLASQNTSTVKKVVNGTYALAAHALAYKAAKYIEAPKSATPKTNQAQNHSKNSTEGEEETPKLAAQ